MKVKVLVQLPAGVGLPLQIAQFRNGQFEPVPAGRVAGASAAKAAAIAPAHAVARFSLPLLARSEAEASNEALFAVEDDLAQPVETVCLTLGRRTKPGVPRDIYVVDKTLFTYWIEALESAGLPGLSIFPENGFEWPAGTVSDFGDRLLLSGASGIVALDTAMPEDAVQTVMSAIGLDRVPVRRVNAFDELAAKLGEQAGIALIGPGRRTGGSAHASGARAWKLAAGMAAAACVMAVASIGIETVQLTRAAAKQERLVAASFQKAFPGSPVPGDIHAEVRRLSQLQTSRTASGFQAMAAAAYSASAASGTVQFSSLTFSEADKSLHVGLTSANREDEAAFRQHIGSAGWAAESQRLTDTPGGVEAEIVIRSPP